jgi:5-methylcytosine-specific restriction endonuclease McrA
LSRDSDEGVALQPAEEVSRDSDEGVALQPTGVAGWDSAEDLTPGPAKDAISGSAKVPSSPPSKSVDLLVSRQKNSLRSADGANGAKDTDNTDRSDGGEKGKGAEECDGGDVSNPGRANPAEPSPSRPLSPPLQPSSAGRPPLPAKVRHAVILRDHARCTHFDPQGRRCTSKRFLEIHHILPRAQGGGDTAENLTLRCHAHHALAHEAA